VATQPRLLLLDELSMGLAPIVVESLYNVVRQLAKEGVTIIVVEQFAEFALDVAEHAAVMTGGRIVHEGPASEVGKHLHDLYLGAHHAGNGNEPGGSSPSA
jgi:branched-chain amino acid transport system ATP-binding protein